MDQREIISNVEIYGLEESIKAAKFPFAKDISKVDGGITPTIERLAAFQSTHSVGHGWKCSGITLLILFPVNPPCTVLQTLTLTRCATNTCLT